jgi:hypothetical protein
LKNQQNQLGNTEKDREKIFKKSAFADFSACSGSPG